MSVTAVPPRGRKATKVSYNVIQIDPRPASKDAMIELLKKNSPVVGIEFTLPALAQYIESNIDGQHISGDGKSAIELAVEVELPAKGTTLGVVRPDADALGAIAVLNLRREEEESGFDRISIGIGSVTDSISKRVRLIAEHDKFSQGPWEKGSSNLSEDQLVFRGLSAIALDHKLSLDDRISRVEKWLCTEDCPGLGLSQEDVLEARAKAKKESTIQVIDGISVIESRNIGATELGYQKSPIIRNDAFRFQGGESHVKYTICQWKEGYINLPAIVKGLNEIEACGGTWGGSKTIAGSPQGVSSSLLMDKLVSIVKSHKMQ